MYHSSRGSIFDEAARRGVAPLLVVRLATMAAEVLQVDAAPTQLCVGSEAQALSRYPSLRLPVRLLPAFLSV